MFRLSTRTFVPLITDTKYCRLVSTVFADTEYNFGTELDRMNNNMDDDGIFGVYFNSDSMNIEEIDEEEVKEEFGKYGNIVFVKKIHNRVYINFRQKTDAENCLHLASHSKYGEIKRGRFGNSGPQNFQKHNSNNFSRNENRFEKNSRTSSQFNKSGYLMSGRDSGNKYFEQHSRDDDDHDWFENKNPRSSSADDNDKRKNHERSQNYIRQEKGSLRNTNSQTPLYPLVKGTSKEFSRHSTDGSQPLLSDDDCPPPLRSTDDCPPPLISAQKAHRPSYGKLSTKGPNLKPGLLPTPPITMRLDYNPDMASIPTQSQTSASDDDSDGPPPLISGKRSSGNRFQSSRNSSSHNNNVEKYGKYVLIANLPEDTTPDEMEKVLYPHIPIYITKPELTNIRMKVLFCLAEFKSRDEATKVAKMLDDVELRNHCLSMITLDELVS